ncbi:UNVERIFIED_CONTAM: hypothetical protein K2H54_061213 [Gekko kuhli]
MTVLDFRFKFRFTATNKRWLFSEKHLRNTFVCFSFSHAHFNGVSLLGSLGDIPSTVAPTMILENTITAAMFPGMDVEGHGTDITIIVVPITIVLLLLHTTTITTLLLLLLHTTTTVLPMATTDIDTATAIVPLALQDPKIILIPLKTAKKKTILAFLLPLDPITLLHPRVAHTTFLLVNFPRHQLGLHLLMVRYSGLPLLITTQKDPIFLHHHDHPVAAVAGTTMTTSGTALCMEEEKMPPQKTVICSSPPLFSLRLLQSTAFHWRANMIFSSLPVQTSFLLRMADTGKQSLSLFQRRLRNQNRAQESPPLICHLTFCLCIPLPQPSECTSIQR